MLAFILKSSLCLITFYCFFLVFLSTEKMHRVKRFYLLFAVFFSFVIPLIKIKLNAPTPKINYEVTQQQLIQSSSNVSFLVTYIKSSFSLFALLCLVYICVAILLLIRFTLNIYKLRLLQKNNPSEIQDRLKLVFINQNTLPYSFWNSIFVNKHKYEDGNISKVLLLHEFSHARQKHSLDILLIEFIQVFFWFNPIINLYKKAIRLNHEYLADDYVLNSNISLIDFQNQIIEAALRNSPTFLASNFNCSLTKKRLLMLYRDKTKHTGYKIAMVPLLAALLFYFLSCSKENLEIKNPVNNNHVEQKRQTNEPWWNAIALKHGIELHAYNGFPNLVEMGSTNSVNFKIARLKDAVFIFKEDENNYIILRSPIAFHNLGTNIIEGKGGSMERYAFNSAGMNPVERIQLDKNFRFQLKEQNVYLK